MKRTKKPLTLEQRSIRMEILLFNHIESLKETADALCAGETKKAIKILHLSVKHLGKVMRNVSPEAFQNA